MEVIAKLAESWIMVIDGQGFLVFMSVIFSLGMYYGNKHDDGFNGFKRSVGVILPWVAIVILTNIFRIVETARVVNITGMAFNGTVTALITTICYIPGLFVGHMIKEIAEEQALKEHLHKNEDL